MDTYDVVVVGAGPAGAAAALGARYADPAASVLLLDRASFPRDKPCGDGIAPHALDLLAARGVSGFLDDQVPVTRLRLRRGSAEVAREMDRAAYVVPRRVFDARLVAAALEAGAQLRRHRVRAITLEKGGGVVLDGQVRARVLVGADGAHSRVRESLGLSRPRSAFAIRGYAPTGGQRRGEQIIVFGRSRQPSYAWSFDRGDGWANVGYGELPHAGRPPPSRAMLLGCLADLLPGATAEGRDWRGHHLPLSSWRWRPRDGPILLVGDAAGLVNPLTGEGIAYAVATGLAAGEVATRAVTAGDASAAGRRYRAATAHLLRSHLRHSAVAARAAAYGPVLDAGLRAAASRQGTFDDLVDLGLGTGRLTGSVLGGMLGQLARRTSG